jgi:hypothetical protein
LVGQKTKLRAALKTKTVLKENRAATDITAKGFHKKS